MHVSGPVSECECGKLYWDAYNTGYSWSDGEEESLRSNPNATSVPHGVEKILLEGHIYCMDCTCWHPRAERIIAWLREHQEQIGQWYALEKRRLKAAMEAVPSV